MATLVLQKLKELPKYLSPLVLGAAIFSSAMHHIFDLWNRPALIILGSFALGLPVFAFTISIFWKKFSHHLFRIQQKRFFLFLLVSLFIGSFISWRVYNVPASYHLITITPILSSNETIELLEIKAHQSVLKIEKIAVESEWKKQDGSLLATRQSKPIAVSFLSKANTPVTVLFKTSPESGTVQVSLDGKNIETNLQAPTNELNTLRFTSKYRGIPNWIFIPILLLADIITFGGLILFMLIMQEIGQKEAGLIDSKPDRINHKKNLWILTLTGLTIHTLNALAVPLFLAADSPTFLQGSIHLLKYGNLDGVSMFRGPGTTLLFAPVIFIFGRNPWGIKILLHLLAFACIPICYRIGWQLSKNGWVAFVSGVLAIFSPDLLFYSNFVMSDVPNVFIVLLFITLLISALESAQRLWYFLSMATGSMAVLLRSENILMLAVGMFVLVVFTTGSWMKDHANLKKRLIDISLSFVLAILPILWWSSHNLKQHGFFGMSNYGGEVFYDGWVYFGDASYLSFSTPDSPSMQIIQSAIKHHPIIVTDKSGFPTGWEIYPALLQAGYTSSQAFQLLEAAAWESILGNKETALELLFIKYRIGLTPEITYNVSYPLPNEPVEIDITRVEFFDEDVVSIPPLIKFQRMINSRTIQWYPELYPTWVLFSILVVFISLFRSPFNIWSTVTVITIFKIFIPLTIGIAYWRYSLTGWFPAQIMTVTWIWTFGYGLRVLLKTDHN